MKLYDTAVPLIVIGVIVALLWLFTGFRTHNLNDIFSENGEMVEYSLYCSVPYVGGECKGEVRAGSVTTYRINHARAEVVVTWEPRGRFLKQLTNCVIMDKESWKCPDGKLRFEEGSRMLTYDTKGQYKFVSGWEYRLQRIRDWW